MTDVHRNITQLLLEEGALSESDLINHMGDCIDLHKHEAIKGRLKRTHDEARDKKTLEAVVDRINGQLDPLGLKIANMKSKLSGEYEVRRRPVCRSVTGRGGSVCHPPLLLVVVCLFSSSPLLLISLVLLISTGASGWQVYYGLVNLKEHDGFAKQQGWLKESEQEFFHMLVDKINESEVPPSPHSRPSPLPLLARALARSLALLLPPSSLLLSSTCRRPRDTFMDTFRPLRARAHRTSVSTPARLPTWGAT